MKAFYRVKIMNGMVFPELSNDNGGFFHITKDSVQMHLYMQKKNDYWQGSLHNGVTVRPCGHEPVALSFQSKVKYRLMQFFKV